MKITSNLAHIATETKFEAAKSEADLQAAFDSFGLPGFPAELDIAERTEDHVQMTSLEQMLGFARAAKAGAVLYDVTYFPHADEAQVDYQLDLLSKDLEIGAEVLRSLCASEIEEYLELDAKRDAAAPVHSIVEAYVGGTAVAWYGMNDYPRLKHIVLSKLAQGGEQAKRSFIVRASKAQVELLEKN